MNPVATCSAEAVLNSPSGRSTPGVPEVVKSAVRVLQVLEFFDRTRAPANICVVATALDFPQSSTSALMRSLTKIGYLRHDPYARTYFPTERVSLLGKWIADSLIDSGPVLRLLESLSHATGCVAVLARRNGDEAQYVYVTRPAGDRTLDGVTMGTSLPLTSSAAGLALLSMHRDEEVKRLVHRLNANTTSSEQIVRIPALLERLAQIRRKKTVFEVDRMCGVMAATLPASVAETPMVIGLAGCPDMLQSKAVSLDATLRAELDRLPNSARSISCLPHLVAHESGSLRNPVAVSAINHVSAA